VLGRSVGAQLTGTPRYPRAARACLAALVRARPRDAVSRLQAVLLSNVFLALDAARALGKIGGGDAEAALIGALEGDVFESRLAAAEVLAEVGSIAAVPALREAERQGLQIRRLARQAIADIQARATGTPGAVSLAGAEAGQVSIAEDFSGRVALSSSRRSQERP
jgi:HEAT repeat protein